MPSMGWGNTSLYQPCAFETSQPNLTLLISNDISVSFFTEVGTGTDINHYKQHQSKPAKHADLQYFHIQVCSS